MGQIILGGKAISSMTLGTAQLGFEYGIANKSGKPDRDVRFRMLQTALELGVSCFDTASIYGDSERLLGDYFTGMQEQPAIISKIKFSDNRGISKAELQQEINDRVEHVLENLRLAQLPVLMLHQPDSLADRNETIADILKQLKRDGLVHSVGVSLDANSDEQYQKYWPFIRDDLYESLQIPLNVLDQRLIHLGALSSFEAAGKVVFARSVFLQGLFFLPEEELPANIRDEVLNPLRSIRGLAEHEGISVAQLAIAFVRDLPEISSLVIGAETVEQLQDNSRLMQGPPISERTRTELLMTLKDVPAHVLMPVLWR